MTTSDELRNITVVPLIHISGKPLYLQVTAGRLENQQQDCDHQGGRGSHRARLTLTSLMQDGFGCIEALDGVPCVVTRSLEDE